MSHDAVCNRLPGLDRKVSAECENVGSKPTFGPARSWSDRL